MFNRLLRGAAVLVCSIFLVMSSGCIAAAAYTSAVMAKPFTDGGPPASPLACTLSGPYQTNNLTIYLIHGPDQAAHRSFLTLASAMESGQATVDETGSVNQLQIHNRSDAEVFVQGGQIVKGGRQDRTLAFDLIVPPANSTPIDAFCVEHERWTGRSGDSSAYFSAPGGMIASQSLRLAVMDQASQSAVWNAVANVQEILARSVNQDVTSPQSPSSLQLTLENPTLLSQMREYQSMEPIVQNHADAIGYVCLINGRLICAEVYGSRQLFTQLWPKLLSANAIESIAARRDAPSTQPTDSQGVVAFLHRLEQGAAATRTINDRTTIARYVCDQGVLFQTVTPDGGWLHRTYLSRQ